MLSIACSQTSGNFYACTAQEKDEFVENILADVKDLGISYQRVTYTSDYFPQLLDLAERLIRAGHLYADDTPTEQMRAVRGGHAGRMCTVSVSPCDVEWSCTVHGVAAQLALLECQGGRACGRKEGKLVPVSLETPVAKMERMASPIRRPLKHWSQLTRTDAPGARGPHV